MPLERTASKLLRSLPIKQPYNYNQTTQKLTIILEMLLERTAS
jgi:hypothetical protein